MSLQEFPLLLLVRPSTIHAPQDWIFEIKQKTDKALDWFRIARPSNVADGPQIAKPLSDQRTLPYA